MARSRPASWSTSSPSRSAARAAASPTWRWPAAPNPPSSARRWPRAGWWPSAPEPRRDLAGGWRSLPASPRNDPGRSVNRAARSSAARCGLVRRRSPRASRCRARCARCSGTPRSREAMLRPVSRITCCPGRNASSTVAASDWSRPICIRAPCPAPARRAQAAVALAHGRRCARAPGAVERPSRLVSVFMVSRNGPRGRLPPSTGTPARTAVITTRS